MVSRYLCVGPWVISPTTLRSVVTGMKAPAAGFVHLEDVDMLNAVIVVNLAITDDEEDEAMVVGGCCRLR